MRPAHARASAGRFLLESPSRTTMPRELRSGPNRAHDRQNGPTSRRQRRRVVNAAGGPGGRSPPVRYPSCPRPRERRESPEPLVAVVIPALNEAGKIGRVLDKMPADPRFEAIVVDDGSTDGTGDEARAHGAALVVRHEQRQGVGAAIRDGWKAALERDRPYVALVSGDDQHEPAELVPAFETLLARDADYVQGSRWRPGGRVEGPDERAADGHPHLLARLQRARAAPRSPMPPTGSASSGRTSCATRG